MDKEKAIEIGHKVMIDIEFDWWDKKDESGVLSRFITKEIHPTAKDEYWLVSFPYGKEDYGENVHYMISIIDSTEIATKISFRNGAIKLGIDTDGKYFIAERRP